MDEKIIDYCMNLTNETYKCKIENKKVNLVLNKSPKFSIGMFLQYFGIWGISLFFSFLIPFLIALGDPKYSCIKTALTDLMGNPDTFNTLSFSALACFIEYQFADRKIGKRAKNAITIFFLLMLIFCFCMYVIIYHCEILNVSSFLSQHLEELNKFGLFFIVVYAISIFVFISYTEENNL